MSAERFQNKYRIPSARAEWWDYGDSGAYFITICTKNKARFFGKIVESRLVATEIGELAETLWHEIPQRFPYAQLGAFVVMPNHIHGIVIIEKSSSVETRFIASSGRKQPESDSAPTNSDESTKPAEPTLSPGGITGDKNPMLSDNLSRLLRWVHGEDVV